MMLKTIVLEDEDLIAQDLAQTLRDLGHEVCGIAHRVVELAPLMQQHAPDLVTIDVNLGDRRDGIGVATVLEAAGPLPIVFVTGAADEQEQEEMRTIEGAALVFKPFTRETLKAAIDLALARTREAKES
jgi:AmiR/NasT family two-component response regulator